MSDRPRFVTPAGELVEVVVDLGRGWLKVRVLDADGRPVRDPDPVAEATSGIRRLIDRTGVFRAAELRPLDSRARGRRASLTNRPG